MLFYVSVCLCRGLNYVGDTFTLILFKINILELKCWCLRPIHSGLHFFTSGYASSRTSSINVINKITVCYESRVTSCRLVRNHAGSCVTLSFSCCRSLTAFTRPSLQTSAGPSESCRCSTALAQVSFTCPSAPVKQPYAPAFPHRPFFSPSGFYVLKVLGIKIDKYIASEVCEDSVAVATINHDGKIVHIGDVRHITQERVRPS